MVDRQFQRHTLAIIATMAPSDRRRRSLVIQFIQKLKASSAVRLNAVLYPPPYRGSMGPVKDHRNSSLALIENMVRRHAALAPTPIYHELIQTR